MSLACSDKNDKRNCIKYKPMERQEFDLKEYSLVVRDGKAVLERKAFRPGDVLSNELGAVVIYAGTEEGDGIVTYAGYWPENGVFTSVKDTGWGRMEGFDCAAPEQKAMLFAEIDRRGYVWDAEKLELRRKRWRAKKGERYWHCEFGQEQTRVFSSVEMGRDVDDFRFENENYFMSEKDVVLEVEKIKK